MESAWWWCPPHLASLSLSPHNRGWRWLGGVALREEEVRPSHKGKEKRAFSYATRKEKGKQQEEERRGGGRDGIFYSAAP